MANSKRAPLRARSRAPEDMRAPKGATVRAMKARAPKKSAQTVVVEEQIAEGEDPATVRLDGRRLSRRIEFTPRLVEHIRLRYEEAGDSLDVISRSIDIAKATLLRLVREQQWTRAPRGPRDLSPAARLLMETRALEDDAAPRAQDVSSQTASPHDASPDDTAAILDRLLRAVMRELAAVEAMRAEMKNTPQRPRDAIATAQTLANLTETLNKLQRMRCGLADQHHDDSDDLPTDIDARREALARRIEAFFASRPDEGLPAGVEPKRADGA